MISLSICARLFCLSAVLITGAILFADGVEAARRGGPSGEQKTTVRDHRTQPIVRDHRTKPIIRDHRTKKKIDK